MTINNLRSVIRCPMQSGSDFGGSAPAREASAGAATGGEGGRALAGGAVCLNPVISERNFPQGGLLPEPLVARVIGVKKRRLVATRKQRLAKGDDWALVRNIVSYTPAGLEKLLAALGLSGAAFAWPAPGEWSDADHEPEAGGEALDGAGEALAESPKIALALPAPGHTARDQAAALGAQVVKIEAGKVEQLTVVRIFGNPSLLEAARDDGTRVRVRVAKNENFIRGMKLKARLPAAGSPVWDLVGHCPRWRGRY